MQQPRLNLDTTNLVLGLTLCLSLAQGNAQAQDIGTMTAEQDTGFKPSVTLESSRLLWAEHRSSRSTSVTVALSKSLSKSLSLGLSQNINHSAERADETHDATQIGSTSASVTHSAKLGSQVSSAVKAGLSRSSGKLSAITTKRGGASLKGSLMFSPAKWIGLSTGVGGQYFFYRDTFSNIGNANPYGQLSANIGLELQIPKTFVSLHSSIEINETKYYEGAESQYGQAWVTGVTLQVLDSLVLYGTAGTDNNQLENDDTTALAMLDDDVTTITFGGTYTF